MVVFKDRLLKEIDPTQDSIRIYYLGRNWENKTEHFGAKPTQDLEGPLVI
jgi:CRISPR-associated protein Cas2